MRKQRGLSLIELMVAMLIGLVITGAVIQVFISNKSTFVMQDAMSHLQENGRFAVQYLAAEIRPAGIGMGVRLADENICVVATASSNAEWNAMNRPIWGLRVTGSGNYGAVGTDQVHLFSNDDCGAFLTAGEFFEPVSNANIKVTEYCPSMLKDRAVMVMDMQKAVILRINNSPNANAAPVTLNHSAGSNSRDADCGGFKFSAISFSSPARVVGFNHKIFYVAETGRTGGSGQPVRALFVRDVVQAQAVEVVEGVESMRVSYGLASASSAGVQDYLTAPEVEAASRWDEVRSVKVDLLLVSDERAPGAQTQSLTFDGEAVTADGRLRQVFHTVVALRNRID